MQCEFYVQMVREFEVYERVDRWLLFKLNSKGGVTKSIARMTFNSVLQNIKRLESNHDYPMTRATMPTILVPQKGCFHS